MVQLVKCLQHDQRCNLQFPSTHMKKLDMACACNFSGGWWYQSGQKGIPELTKQPAQDRVSKTKTLSDGKNIHGFHMYMETSECTSADIHAPTPPPTHKINSRKQTFILPTYLPTQDKVSVCSLDWRWNLLCRPGWSWTQRITCLWLRSTGIKGMYPQTRPNLQMIFM